jgi:TPR repeat protein
MKCILCKMCQAARAAFDEKAQAWIDTQTNETAMWERESEADQERIRYAHSLESSNPAQSLSEYLALAEQGSLWSMVRAAFASGTGTPPDLAQAEKWYRCAYENGSDEGLLQLGDYYVKTGQFAKAEEVFKTGVERGLTPALYRLAWAYSKSGQWPQKREEALVLLERSSAAGDLYGKLFLARAMIRGWFGLRLIPHGIRLINSVADDLGQLVGNEELAASRRDSDAQLGFFRRLARPWLLGAMRIPAS